MKKFLATLVGLVALGALIYGGNLALTSMKASAKLDDAKAALMKDARVFERYGDARVAQEWRAVAKDYLSPYEQGRLDELFAETARGYERYAEPNGWGLNSYGTFSAQVFRR